MASSGTEAVYRKYVPFPEFRDLPHPALIAETISLASVGLARPNYEHSIDKRWLNPKSSRLSGIQMDAVILAGGAHEQFINQFRQGFILGDGTGVGKGRQIAAMVVDNWMKGRKKSIWISSNRKLFHDSKRDLDDVVKQELPIFIHRGYAFKFDPIMDGIVFGTYHSLINNKDDKSPTLDNMFSWVGGASFAGLVVLDECHKAKGLTSCDENFDCIGSDIGKAVFKLQKILPNARFVYATATVGTTPNDLQYVQRLGLWDASSGFGGSKTMSFFVDRGLAGSEVLAAQLKFRGVMVSRQLSYDGVEFDVERSNVAPEFINLFNKCCKLWEIMLTVVATLEENLYSAYWSAAQKFFKALCISSKMPHLLNLMRENLGSHCSVVVSVTSTHEESYLRFRKSIYHDESTELFRPCRQMIEEFLLFKFQIPHEKLKLEVAKITSLVNEYISDDESDSDESGPHKRKVPGNKTDVYDQICSETLSRILELYFEIKNDLPLNPLDVLIMTFNKPNGVVELTSRRLRQRLLTTIDGIVVVEKEEPRKQQHESRFQDGSCRVALISEASSTGISLHSSSAVVNSQKRVQILLETPWTSMSALQVLGRTHRSDQKKLPYYIVLTSAFPGEERFVNAVAGRICALGALCKADRRSSFYDAWKSFQVCPQIAKHAIKNVVLNILGLPSSVNFFPPERQNERAKWIEILDRLGIIVSSKRLDVEWMPNAKLMNQEKFLNRLMVLEFEKQKKLMSFYKTAIKRSSESSGMIMNDGVEDLTLSVKGKIDYANSLVYKRLDLTCNIHIFECIDVCLWDYVKDAGCKSFFENSDGKILGARNNSDNPGDIWVYKPQRHHNQLYSNTYIRGYSKISIEEAEQKWKQQTDDLLNGCCTKFAQKKCTQKRCKTHRMPKMKFGLFTGMISAILQKLIDQLDQRGVQSLKLYYHNWGNQSDTGIFLSVKHIRIAQICLTQENFIMEPV